jgi:hypothetical protein
MTQQETSEFVSDLRRAFSAVEVCCMVPFSYIYVMIAFAASWASSQALVLFPKMCELRSGFANADSGRGEWLCSWRRG